MSTKTYTIDTDHWQVVPKKMTYEMRNVVWMGDGDWRELLAAAPEPPVQQPRRPYGTDTMSEYGVIPECDGSEPPAQQQDEQLPPYSAWLHVLDEAMVARHLGVADPDDDYITAKRKLHAMFDWEIDVATDPAVGGDRVRKQPTTNEQWQVVPQELTGSMIDTINGHIDADSDAVALWRDALIDAPEPPAQQPTRDLLAEATEQVEALDRENHRMRRCVARLMARLTVWLDDDQFNEADGIMYPEFEPPAQQPTEPYVVRAHSYGGLTGINDYLMSNGSVVAMRPDEAAKCRPPAPAQQPMTNKQAHAIAEEVWDEYGIPRWQTLRIIRDTELHHGIGKDRI